MRQYLDKRSRPSSAVAIPYLTKDDPLRKIHHAKERTQISYLSTRESTE